VIFDAHPKEFNGVELQQTVFVTGLDKYIGTFCIVQKWPLDKGLVTLNYLYETYLFVISDVSPNLYISDANPYTTE